MIIQTLRCKRIDGFRTVFEVKEDSGEKVLKLTAVKKGKNKGKICVNFRETVNPIQFHKFPYLVSTTDARTICGIRTLPEVYGFSYSDINGYATLIETDYTDNLTLYITDKPKEQAAEVFKEWRNK